MAVDIKVWGPSCWNFLYAVVFSYPEQPTVEDKEAVSSFFNSLHLVLPCTHCREHFSRFLKQQPVELNNGSRSQVSSWLLSLNNDVNSRIGKPTLTMKEVWGKLVEDSPKRRRHCYANAVVLTLVGAALLYVLYLRSKK